MWIYSLVAIAVVGCAILAAMGFKGRVTTVGVDLGTSFSVVGLIDNGKVRIVQDKEGRQIFPSIVSFQDGGKVLSLYDAVPYLASDPSNTIYNAKRFVARRDDSPEFRQYAASHPYAVEFTQSSNFSDIGFRITATGFEAPSPTKGHNAKDPRLQLVDGLLSPEAVAVEVLRGLMRVTATFLGHDQVNKAVIAVPAKFTPEQRAATAAAYKAAGLKVVRLVEEPTAAAMAYDLHKDSSVHHIIVYDFGGGTLDVSLLYVAKGSIQVYATDGDDSLGGSDFDICVEELLHNKLCVQGEEEMVEDSTEEIDADQDEDIVNEVVASVKSDRMVGGGRLSEVSALCSAAERRKLAEQVKKQLSSSDEVIVRCIDTPEGMAAMRAQECTSIPTQSNRTLFSVHRQEFESSWPSCSALFDRAILPLSRLLDGLGMAASDVDEVVLVGGSTRIPHVKTLLRKYFGPSTPINDNIDPDVTVACGAASIID